MSILDGDLNARPEGRPVIEGVTSLPGSRPLRTSSDPAAFSQPFVPQTNGQPGGPSDPPVFKLQVGRSLRMHGTLAILVGLAVCLLLVAFGLKQPRTYTASSVIYVEPMVARNLNEQGVPGFDQFRYGSFLDQQIQTIVRPDVLAAALRTLPAGTWRGPLESEQSAVARLAKALTVERVLTSYQIDVQLKANDPDAAAAIVNAVTNAYLQRGREDEFKQADLREQILSEERDRVKQELEIDRKEQAALGASMGLASPADGAGNPYDADLANLRGQLATARQARDVAAAQLSSVSGPEASHESGLKATADDSINTDPGLSAKKAAVNARRVVLESLMAGMTPGNPQYRQAQDEIADLDRALETKTVEVRAQSERRIQDKLRTDLQRTADVESKVNAQLAQATAKATGAGPKLQRAAELANDIQRLTARYTTVDETLNALELETSGPGMAHVPLPAAVPLAPDPNHRDLFFMAALPLGLFFGASAAVIARMRDRRVYLGADLQQSIGFAPLAVLPAREDVSKQVIDEYGLRLAAGVESAYRTAGAQTFVVTAVSAETGIGTLLHGLAGQLADLRLRVLMIRASELLVTSQETMEHQAASAALIAAGAAVPVNQVGEGIASAKLDRMKVQHDIILIDAAPLLHSAETEYAARCADATILVAESALTQTTELVAATELLSRLRVTGVGAVLAEVKLEQADKPFRSAVRVIEQRSLESVVTRKPAWTQVQPEVEPPAPRKPIAVSIPVTQPAPAKATFAESAPPQVTGPVPVKLAPQPVTPAAVEKHAEAPQPPIERPVRVVPPAAARPAPVVEKVVPVVILAVQPAVEEPVIAAAVAVPPPAAAVPPPAAVKAMVAAARFQPVPMTPPVAPLTPSPVATGAAIEPVPAGDESPEASATPVLPAPPRVFARPPIPVRSFKHWTVSPEISAEESAQAAARPTVRQRLQPLAEISPSSSSAPLSSAQAPVQPAPAPLTATTVSVDLPVSALISTKNPEKQESEAQNEDDLHEIGRFISEKDKIGAVPPYTRSKIRLAFKEQEVNSKTTWFSKLFRGDPPATFRFIPDDADEDGESLDSPKLQWEKPPARLPEARAEGDPELSHLLNRIKTSGETKVAPRPQPVAVEPEPVVAAGPSVPFMERRIAPRPVEIDEYRAPAPPVAATAPAQAAAPVPVPVPFAAVPAAPAATPPATPRWEPPVPNSLTPPLAPAPPSFAVAAPAAPAFDPATAAPAIPGSRPYGRPLRPLTFQQLAGSIEADALAEQPQRPVQPAPQAQAIPASTAPQAAYQPAYQPEAAYSPQTQVPTQVPTQAQPVQAAPAPYLPPAPVHAAPFAYQPPPQPLVAPPAVSQWELPPAAVHAAPEPVAPLPPPLPPSSAPSVSHTGMPMWPMKEPLVSTHPPLYRPAEPEPAPEPTEYLAASAPEVEGPATVAAEAAFAQEQPVRVPDFVAPTPSARRSSFERIPIVPDPLSDPAPAPRPYRFDSQGGGFDPAPASDVRSVLSEPADAPTSPSEPVQVATVPAGTSFPPDHEARLHMFARRRSDLDGDANGAGLTRRWKLLSQFEPVLSDPLPANRKGYTRTADLSAPQPNEEG